MFSLFKQAELLAALSAPVAAALPSLQPVHVATALWSHAVVGAGGSHIDHMLQQVSAASMTRRFFSDYGPQETAAA
jgi:uncharacterized protein YaaW (UPF0174 family)